MSTLRLITSKAFHRCCPTFINQVRAKVTQILTLRKAWEIFNYIYDIRASISFHSNNIQITNRLRNCSQIRETIRCLKCIKKTVTSSSSPSSFFHRENVELLVSTGRETKMLKEKKQVNIKKKETVVPFHSSLDSVQLISNYEILKGDSRCGHLRMSYLFAIS